MIFLLVIPLIYSILLLRILAGFEKTELTSIPSEINDYVSISIIIAARNEEKNIPTLIKSLASLKYPSSHFELIIADDHSEDETVKICNSLFEQFQLHGKVIHSSGEGKKIAIANGIKEATGKLIVTTDADCTFHPDWLQTILNYYKFTSAGMMLMPVVLTGENLFARLQHVESLALAGVAAGSLQNGYPLLSNGAAMAFEKQVYAQYNNNDLRFDIASGDDMFLMLNYYKQFPNKITFINHPSATVNANAQTSIADFLQQRIRWSAKTKQYTQKYIVLFGLLIILYALLIISTVVLFLYQPSISNLWLLSIPLIKMTIDYIFLQRVSEKLKQPFYSKEFFVWQFVYPVYILITGILSIAGVYKWKGRSYRN